MRLKLGLVLLMAFLIVPHNAGAQGNSAAIAGPISTPLLTGPHARWTREQPLALDSVPPDIRPTHWKEGALIGGLTLGLGLAVLSGSLCDGSDGGGTCGGATAGGFLLGAVLGGLAGALIGGQFPKDVEM